MKPRTWMTVTYGKMSKGVSSAIHELDNDEEGVTATEYVILLVLVACFIIAVVALFGEELRRTYQQALDALYFM